jgi:hypothetical protein
LLVPYGHSEQIAIAAGQIRQFEEDAETHKLVVAECTRLAAELEAANAEKDRLFGESPV